MNDVAHIKTMIEGTEREEAIKFLKNYLNEEVYTEKCRNAHEMAIKAIEQQNKLFKIGLLKDCESCKALEQELRKDEVILTKEEYGELVSSEFDNGYTKGYKEALEQNDVLNKLRAEINGMYRVILKGTPENDWAVKWNNCLDEVLQIIDKYRAESEE